MERQRKILAKETIQGFRESIDNMPAENRIFVDRSVEIAMYIFQLMEKNGMKQRDLAEKMGKSEAEVSKWLTGMHNYTLRSFAKLEAALGEAVVCTPKPAFIHVPVTGEKVSSRATMKAMGEPQKAMSYTMGKLVQMKHTKADATTCAEKEEKRVKAI